jgi:hypothetical protein
MAKRYPGPVRYRYGSATVVGHVARKECSLCQSPHSMDDIHPEWSNIDLASNGTGDVSAAGGPLTPVNLMDAQSEGGIPVKRLYPVGKSTQSSRSGSDAWPNCTKSSKRSVC